MAQGFKLDFARKVSKNGSHYTSINLGVVGTIVVYDGDDGPSAVYLYPREQKDDAAKPSATVVDLVHRPLDKPRATASKGFFNDQLPESWKDGHIA